MIDASRATECQKIMPMRLALGSNALHYVVIAKHFLITADFVVQSQVAHHSPGSNTGLEFHQANLEDLMLHNAHLHGRESVRVGKQSVKKRQGKPHNQLINTK